MEKRNKIFFVTTPKTIVYILAIVFLFLNTEKELLHNHEHDLHRHDDCPVHLVNQILSSGITVHFEISCEQSSLVVNFPLVELHYVKTFSSFIYLRAPPLV